MFATSTRLAALVVLLAAALPSIAAGPTRRQTFDLGGLTVNLGELADGLAAPGDVQILAPSQAARVKARTVRRRAAQYHVSLCPGSFQACSLPSGSFECREYSSALLVVTSCIYLSCFDASLPSSQSTPPKNSTPVALALKKAEWTAKRFLSSRTSPALLASARSVSCLFSTVLSPAHPDSTVHSTDSCVEGYRPNLDKTACVPISNSRRFHRRH